MSLGDRLKEIRKDNNLTQEAFAEKISVSRPFISRIEADKEKPSDSLIKLISAIFNVELNWIKYGSGIKETAPKTVRNVIYSADAIPLEENEKFDLSEQASILAHLLNSPKIKHNSEIYYRSKIRSILMVLDSFFCRNDINEYEFQDVEVIITYIEKKIYEALDALKNENLDEE